MNKELLLSWLYYYPGLTSEARSTAKARRQTANTLHTRNTNTCHSHDSMIHDYMRIEEISNKATLLFTTYNRVPELDKSWAP